MRVHAFTIDEIYESLTDDDVFAQLPTRLAEAYGGRSTLIHWHHHDGDADVLAHSGYFADEHLGRYAREFARYDPWAIAAAGVPSMNFAMNLEHLVSQPEYERSFFYNEFIRVIGDDTIRAMGVRIANGFGTGMLAIHRGRTQDSFDARAVESLNAISVELRRMLSVRGRFGGLDRKADSLKSMLDCLGHAAILVRSNGMVVHLNAAGEGLVRRANHLKVVRGRLEAADGVTGAALKKAVHLACAETPSAGAVMLPAAADRPKLLTVVPVAKNGHRCALLLLQDGAGSATRKTTLRHLFSLTPAEVEIAFSLAEGSSPRHIAAARSVSFSTLRGQIKSIAQKMDCHRQSEIVSLIAALVPMHS